MGETLLQGAYNSFLNGAVNLSDGLVGSDGIYFVPVNGNFIAAFVNPDAENPADIVPIGLKGTECILVAVSSDGGNITVKAGTGIQGTQDLELTLEAGLNVIRLETGKFIQTKSNNIGGDGEGETTVAGCIKLADADGVIDSVVLVSLVNGEDPTLAVGGDK